MWSVAFLFLYLFCRFPTLKMQDRDDVACINDSDSRNDGGHRMVGFYGRDVVRIGIVPVLFLQQTHGPWRAAYGTLS
jgi:hypothetical protein